MFSLTARSRSTGFLLKGEIDFVGEMVEVGAGLKKEVLSGEGSSSAMIGREIVLYGFLAKVESEVLGLSSFGGFLNLCYFKSIIGFLGWGSNPPLSPRVSS